MKNSPIVVVGEDQFNLALAQSSGFALVKFGNNTRCPPCLAVEPVMHKLAHDFGPQLAVIEVDSDLKANAFAHARFKFQGIPHFFFLADGNILGKLAGFGDYAPLLAWVTECANAAGIEVPDSTNPNPNEIRFAALAAELWQTYDSAVDKDRALYREANTAPSAALQAAREAAANQLSDGLIDKSAHDAAVNAAQEAYMSVMRPYIDAYQAVNKPAYAAYTDSLKSAVAAYLASDESVQDNSASEILDGATCALGDPSCRS